MPSIAAVNSAFAPLPLSGAGAIDPVPAVEAVARVAPQAPRGEGQRRELVDVTAMALGLPRALDRSTEQAVVRFAQALMHDLRTVAGAHDDAPSTQAAGQRAWSDLSQRLSALATAAGRQAPAPMAEMPATPNPVTPATAAVHIMKVPSSRVLEAFVSLQRAMGQEAQVASPDQARRALADLAQRLATSAAPAGGGPVKAGAVLDVRV